MYQHEEILKIEQECAICGTRWQFENIDNVAEKSINHHYKSGECEKKYNERRSVTYAQFMSGTGTVSFNYSNYRSTSSSTGTSTWTNPQRGMWNYT